MRPHEIRWDWNLQDWIESDKIGLGENRRDHTKSDQMISDDRCNHMQSDMMRWSKIRWDEIIQFNQMNINSIEQLWDMPDQPLWLPLVCLIRYVNFEKLL